MDFTTILHFFRRNPLLSEQHPGLIRKFDIYPEDRTPWNIIIKTTGSHEEAYKRIAEVYDGINPGGPFEAHFIEDQIADAFAEYTRMQIIIIIFTVIAIFVSSLGLFAMSTYYIRARSRNIAVQKVFGADKSLIMKQIISSYIILSLIAFTISVPVSRLLTAKWLEQFSYQTASWVPWLLILASGLLACLIAFLTVLYQSLKAVGTNPVTTIRRDD